MSAYTELFDTARDRELDVALHVGDPLRGGKSRKHRDVVALSVAPRITPKKPVLMIAASLRERERI